MDDTRSRLLEAAGVEFAREGFARATIRSICKRAGVNQAAVNYHFGDKERLYAEVLNLCKHPMTPESQWSETEWSEVMSSGDPESRLRRFVSWFLRNVVAVGEPWGWRHQLMTREMAEPSEALTELVERVIRPKFELLQEIVRELLPDSTPRERRAIAFSIVGQCIYYRLGRAVAERLVGPQEFATLNESFLTEHITRLTLAALRGMNSSRSSEPRERGVDPGDESAVVVDGGPTEHEIRGES